ncbi:TPA: plasmid segregation protein ParM domain-containing protein, partial [Klebsiella oxytoca]
MNIYCDDGSTNVKLAWFEGDELQTRVSANSFRHGWKVAEFSAATFNYQVGTLKYTWDSVSRDGHCCKVSDEAAFCLIQRPYISKTLLT